MKRKERYIARLDEVKITRKGDYAFIEYKEGIAQAVAAQVADQLWLGISLYHCCPMPSHAYGWQPRVAGISSHSSL